MAPGRTARMLVRHTMCQPSSKSLQAILLQLTLLSCALAGNGTAVFGAAVKSAFETVAPAAQSTPASVATRTSETSAQGEPALRIWADGRSDLPQDPGLVCITLPNGLRCLLLPNGEPENRVSLRLVVAAGSLYERDNQRGFAHFVEHLAFRGTRSHPGQSLTEELQRRGVDFGMGHTAFTGWDWTLYQLELPDAQSETLDFGLGVLREYAEEIAFAGQDVDRERGVILAEKATRAHPDVLSQAAKLDFLFPGSLHNRRMPIGDESVLRSCTPSQLREFYDTWYRPERMAVVVVGSFDPTQARHSIEARFGRIRARRPAATPPADLVPATASRPGISLYRGARENGVLVLLEHPAKLADAVQDRAWRTAQLRTQLAFAVFQRRLQRLAERQSEKLVQPRTMLGTPIGGWQLASLSAGTSLRHWRDTVALLEQEHRRAYQHGFSGTEVDAMRAAFDHGYVESLEGASTRPSPQLAAQLIGTLLFGGVLATPEATAAEMRPVLARITAEECTAAFREAWTRTAPHVFVVAHEKFEADREEIARVLNASRAVRVEAPAQGLAATLAYEVREPSVPPQHHSHVEDLDLHLSRYGNGVAFNFKETRFTANQVLVYLSVGSGRAIVPSGQPGLDQLAQQSFLQGGVRRHTLEELNEICQARSVRVSFQCEAESNLLVLQTNRTDLPFGLRLLRAYLTDAAFRPEIATQASANLLSFYRTAAASPAGVLPLVSLRHFLNGEHRFRIPYASEISGRTVEELRDWLRGQMLDGPLELAIVGDVPWAEALQAVSQTFGNLPARRPPPDLSGATPSGFANPNPAVFLLKVPSDSGQAAVACHWPIPTPNTIERERRCRLLADLLEERLRHRLRDELGTSYNLKVDYHYHDGFPSLNYMSAFAEFRGASLEVVLAAIRQEADALAGGRLAEDLLLRVHRPFLQRREQDLRSNAYWGYTVLRDAQRHPERIAAARNRTADCAAITRGELLALAAEFLAKEEMRIYAAIPVPPRLMTTEERNTLAEITGR